MPFRPPPWHKILCRILFKNATIFHILFSYSWIIHKTSHNASNKQNEELTVSTEQLLEVLWRNVEVLPSFRELKKVHQAWYLHVVRFHNVQHESEACTSFRSRMVRTETAQMLNCAQRVSFVQVYTSWVNEHSCALHKAKLTTIYEASEWNTHSTVINCSAFHIILKVIQFPIQYSSKCFFKNCKLSTEIPNPRGTKS